MFCFNDIKKVNDECDSHKDQTNCFSEMILNFEIDLH